MDAKWTELKEKLAEKRKYGRKSRIAPIDTRIKTKKATVEKSGSF